ncbi:kelch domain-containing protein 4 [Anabrus simplex]|uniref:kelch domain-containing protein 4 n=1 Tax=Anabrus simplex TaxID=316456 RepID=UPI0035A280A8
MGKKDKAKKKGKGAEKTAAKTHKKLTQKQKKELAAIGEDDIEKIVAQIEQEEKRRQQVVEQLVSAPSRRVNFTLAAHPEKEELILFGGEYFNGQKTFLYNDLFFYNIPRNEWTLVKAPGGPPPRCGHQMVVLSASKGQLWVFGGEYASPTQAQFYHYRDLWMYSIVNKKWEKISAPGGPSARSGHRMVCVKKQLIVFGGFHDNLRDYKYFNDVYAFNLENYTWKKLEPTGTPPPPRSSCIMAALPDGRVLIYGGYSKERIKKDVDKGCVHTDMFLLTPEKHDTTGLKWKWVSIKHAGSLMSPRCGLGMTVAPGNKLYTFGGVWDVEESEEDIAGKFFNDLYSLDLEKTSWRQLALTGKKNSEKVRRRRRKDKGDASGNGDEEMEESGGEASDEDEETASEPASTIVSDDGVFQVTVGPATSTSEVLPTSSTSPQQQHFVPSPRMNCGLAVKHGTLYLYGGMVEDGDRQFTLSDFYSLDLHKLDEWKVLIPSDLASQEWLDSSSSSSGEEEEGEEGEDESDESGSEKENSDGDDEPMETD